VRVFDVKNSVYEGLHAMDWRRYLCAMWILCGELRALNEGWLEDGERSLMASTLEVVRDVVIVGGHNGDVPGCGGPIGKVAGVDRRAA
jgi:hypothetical protein